METGVNQFTAPAEIGPLYPFVGTEVLLAILGIIVWLVWHFLDVRAEGQEFSEAAQLYREVGLERAMHHGGSGRILSEEEIAVDKVYKQLHEENQHKVQGDGDREARPEGSGAEEPRQGENREG